jgi:predicted dehydrogenase
MDLIDYPGGHNEGFPDTFKQLFREVYGSIAGGKSGPATYPTFRDGLRELVLCEKIMESNQNKGWVKVS